MSHSDKAPIVLFCYNRPTHLQKTLNALQKNDLIEDSPLYIYHDGLKENAHQKDREAHQEVCEMINSINWAKEVNIISRERNYGLADNIISGVTEVVHKYGKVIVLEDDIVTSPGFLQYMNNALDMYEDIEEVMHISGYMFPIETTDIDQSTFFYNTASCWGWATYARAWQKLITDPVTIKDWIDTNNAKHHFNIGGYGNFYRQLTENISGKRRTWAVKWYGTMYINKGYALHPSKSLVQNIGNDNSGINSGKSSYYDINTPSMRCLVERIEVKEHPLIRERMKIYYYKSKPLKNTLLRVWRWVAGKKTTL